MGRATQGVKVMNVRDDVVSAVALVVESEPDLNADVAENGATPELSSDGASPPDAGDTPT
jgi:hypothetical protein